MLQVTASSVLKGAPQLQTRSFVYGLQPRDIQDLLDFDYSYGRSALSVAAMIYPFGGHHIQK